MYLSRLKLNPFSRSTRELNGNSYLLHQAIYRAFPDANYGGPGRVLYRLDTCQKGNINLLVQSEIEPDWGKAEILSQCLEEPAEEPKTFPPSFSEGQTLYFLLRANPSVKKIDENRKNGYRLGLLREEDQLNWFKNKAKKGGFEVHSCRTIPEGISRDDKKEQSLRHYAVRFDGVLEVIDPESFKTTIETGIGSAKGFGFGLLSIAPLRGE